MVSTIFKIVTLVVVLVKVLVFVTVVSVVVVKTAVKKQKFVEGKTMVSNMVSGFNEQHPAHPQSVIIETPGSFEEISCPFGFSLAGMSGSTGINSSA